MMFLGNAGISQAEIIDQSPEMQVPEVTAPMGGPVGLPQMVGPTSPPPTAEEVNKMRSDKEDRIAYAELGFWGGIWYWISGLFS